jgi:hypothetical protein
VVITKWRGEGRRFLGMEIKSSGFGVQGSGRATIHYITIHGQQWKW